MQEKAPNSFVRIGDYPRRTKEISVTVVLSKLTKIPKIEEMYQRAEILFKRREQLEKDADQKVYRIMEASKNIPGLDI
jgi:hypothetical protein